MEGRLDMTRGDEMTEKKKLREQMAVHRMHSPQSPYYQPAPIQMRESSGKWHGNGEHVREQRREKRVAREQEMEARVLHRTVSVPDAAPSTTELRLTEAHRTYLCEDRSVCFKWAYSSGAAFACTATECPTGFADSNEEWAQVVAPQFLASSREPVCYHRRTRPGS